MRGAYSHTRASVDLFDWKSDLERLEQHAEAAGMDGVPDPWALAEAQCSIDLIDNELATLRRLDQRLPDVAETVRRHTRWHVRMERVVAQLQQLERRTPDPAIAATAPHPADA